MVGASSFDVPWAELDGEAVLAGVDDPPLTAPFAVHPAATVQAATAAHATRRARRSPR
jgi:hypothetical protein